MLALSLFGSFTATWSSSPMTFATSVTQALLAYLAMESDQLHSREVLATLLWPDLPQATAYTNLRQTLAHLRKAFPSPSDATLVLTITSRTMLCNRTDVSLDVTRFNDLLATCATHQHADLIRCADCIPRLREAATLYQGEFLDGLFLKHSQPFEEWLLVKREAFHLQALEVLYTLAAYHETAAEYGQMYQYAARQLTLEPWREEAHAQAMRALALNGKRSAALAQYETCRRILDAELGVEPSPEMTALYERIRVGELSLTPRSAPPTQHNLPTQLTPFVGRERELAMIAARLQQPDVRLLTLVGAGGMGKTRLALEVARIQRDLFPDGVFFVSLAPLSVAAAIAPAIAAALGLSLQSSDPQHAVIQALRTRHLLLILDNFEHLLDGVDIVVDLLRAAPQVQILATSREQLNVRGEHLHVVEGLEYDPGATLSTAATSSAVRLFVQSARRAQSDFMMNTTNLAAVQHICELVQGMPLGLELAAASMGTLPPEEIAAEIKQSAEFLAVDWADAPERQRSMRAVFAWSWHLLNDAGKRTLRQLALFRGGCTREAAETIIGTNLRTLISLVHKSLLRRVDGNGTIAGRYELHELLRQFAAEQLDAVPGERAVVEARHSAYYLAFAAQQELRLGHDEPQKAVAELRSEMSNIRQAWTEAAIRGRLQDIDRSAYSIWQFYAAVGSAPEGGRLFGFADDQIKQYLERELLDELDKRYVQGVWSKVLAMRASLLLPQGNHDLVLKLTERAISLTRQLNEAAEGEAIAYLVQGQVLRRKGQSSIARDRLVYAAHVAQHARLTGIAHESLPEVEWRAYNWLCSIALTQDDYLTARLYAEAGVEVCRSLGKRFGEIGCLSDIVDIAIATGDYRLARRECEYVLQLARSVGYQRGLMTIQFTLSIVARLQGEYAFAHSAALQGRASCQEAGDILNESYAVRCLAYLHLFMGDYAGTQQWLDTYADIMRAAEMPAREVFLGLLPLALLAHAEGNHGEALAYAERAWQMAQQLDGRSSQGYALVILGMVYVSVNRLDDGTAAYEQALAIYTALDHAHLAAEPQAGLAWIALLRGDLQVAQTHAEAVWQVLAAYPQAGLDEPFTIYLNCYRVLDALHDPRAATVLRTAQTLLHTYAEHISDDSLRQSFLERVATHRAIEQTLLV